MNLEELSLIGPQTIVCDLEIPIKNSIITRTTMKILLFSIKFPKKSRIVAAYVIVDKISGFMYAGSTGNLRKRLNSHRTGIRTKTHENIYIREICTNREEVDFELILIECINREEAYDVEQYLIDYADDLGLLFNRSKDSRLNTRFEFTKEHREKISKRMRERIITSKTRQKLSNALKGRIFNHVSIKKMSASAIKSLEKGDRLERLRKYAEITKKRVSIEGNVYESITAAAATLKLKQNVVTYRLQSTSTTFSNWVYLGEL